MIIRILPQLLVVLGLLMLGLSSQMLSAQTADCNGPGNFTVMPPEGTEGSGTEEDPYVICYDALLNFGSEGVNPSLGFDNPGLIFLAYVCPPGDANIDNDLLQDGGCSTPVAAVDMSDGDITDGGDGFFNLAELEQVAQFLEWEYPYSIYIVPFIVTDVDALPLLEYNPNCTGIDMDFEYPVFTIVDPTVNPTCSLSECDADGGSISTSDNTGFCSSQEVPPNEISVEVEGAMGENYGLVLADADGNVYAGPFEGTVFPTIDVLGIDGNSYFLYGFAYDGALPSIEVGDPVSSLNNAEACSSLSDTAIEIITQVAFAGDVSTEDNTEFLICTDEDKIVTVENSGNANSYGYVLTSADNVVLGLIQSSNVFDFNTTDVGIYYIYGIASADEDLPLIEPGSLVEEILGFGCVDITLESFVEVNILPCECDADAGTISSTVFNICEGIEFVYTTEEFNNSDAYAQLYVLTTPNGTIINFNGNIEEDAGTYNVCAINYLVEGDIEFGTMLEDMLAQFSCYDTTCATLNILPTDDPACVECDANSGGLVLADDAPSIICDGDNWLFAIGSFNEEFAQVYVLTDEDLDIIEINTTGDFTPTPGTYIAHALNIEPSEAPEDLEDLIGLNAVDVLTTLNCFDLSSVEGLVALEPITVNFEGACDEEGIYNYTISFSGGLPAYDGSPYNVFEDDFIFLVEPDELLEYQAIGPNTIVWEIFDDAACSIPYTIETPDCEDPITCTADAGTLTAPANTNVPVGGASEAGSVEGQNTDAGFTYLFLLTDDLDGDSGNGFGYDIVDYNETGEFDLSAYEVGDFFVVLGISFEGSTDDFAALLDTYPSALDWETAIEEDTTICADIILTEFGYALTIACEASAGAPGTGDEFLVCDGDFIAYESFGYNEDFVQVYIMTDAAFNIIYINTDGFFEAAPGSYLLHALNVDPAEAPENLDDLIGENALDIVGTLSCYELQTVASVEVLPQLSYEVTGECNEQSGIYLYSISFSGGLPELDGSDYNVQDGGNTFTVPFGEVFEGEAFGPTNITWELLDNAGCLIPLIIDIPDCENPVDSCDILEAGTISTESETTICTIGNVEDPVVTVEAEGAVSSNFVYVITNGDGSEILAGPLDGPDFDFADVEPGTCLIWGIAYEGSLDVPLGEPASEISSDECFALTNSIAVTRQECYDEITVGEPMFEIDEDNKTYTITIEVMGGSGNYEGTNGDFDGSTFISISFECGQAATIVISDDAGNSITLTYDAPCIVMECPGLSDGGTLIGTQGLVCATTNVGVSAIGFNSGADYTQVYIATQGPNFIVVAISEDGTFGNLAAGDYLLHSLNYYNPQAPVLPEVGESALNIFSQEAACFDLNTNNSLAVEVLNPVEILVDYVCDGSNGVYTLTYSFVGGLPQYVAENGSVGIANEAFYATTGTLNGLFAYGENLSTDYAENTAYNITATDQLNCSAQVTETPPACSKTAIDLLSFDGTIEARGNLLQWTTATEYDNQYFELEKSKDGINFYKLAKIESQGNSNSQQHYEFLDGQDVLGKAYYRLVSVDLSGNAAKSHVILLARTQEWGIVNVFPVPVQDKTTIQFVGTSEQAIELNVLSIDGKLVWQQKLQTQEGSNQIELHTSDWNTGIYLINITDGVQNATYKLIKE